MEHPIYKVVSFEIIGPYTLCVRFDDNKEQVINFKEMLVGEIYGPLKDRKMFEKVEIDPEAHTLVWPNGADFDPETLYHWQRYKEQMKKMVRSWTTGTRA